MIAHDNIVNAVNQVWMEMRWRIFGYPYDIVGGGGGWGPTQKNKRKLGPTLDWGNIPEKRRKIGEEEKEMTGEEGEGKQQPEW